MSEWKKDPKYTSEDTAYKGGEQKDRSKEQGSEERRDKKANEGNNMPKHGKPDQGNANKHGKNDHAGHNQERHEKKEWK